MGQEESPVILGRDGAGVVAKTGENVYKVHPGDKVWFVIPYCLQVIKYIKIFATMICQSFIRGALETTWCFQKNTLE